MCLDKELQSQNRRNVSRSPAGLHQRNVNGLMEARKPSRFHPHTELTGCAGMDFPLESLQLRVHDPIVELKSFIRQQHGGADEEQGPHADNGLGKSEEDCKSKPWEPCSKDYEAEVWFSITQMFFIVHYVCRRQKTKDAERTTRLTRKMIRYRLFHALTQILSFVMLSLVQASLLQESCFVISKCFPTAINALLPTSAL